MTKMTNQIYSRSRLHSKVGSDEPGGHLQPGILRLKLTKIIFTPTGLEKVNDYRRHLLQVQLQSVAEAQQEGPA